MPQFGSMDEEKVSIKKPLLAPLSTMKKQQQQPLSSFLLSEAQVSSLKAALIFGCIYAGAAACLLRDRQRGPPCACPCQCQETDADGVDAAGALLRGLLRCSALQALAAALALGLIAGGRSRRGLGVRAAACVALAAAAAGHWMYLQWLGLRIDGSLGDVVVAVQTACVVADAAFGLLGFTAFVLGVGGDEQAGRAWAG